jgi:hypothetical protein
MENEMAKKATGITKTAKITRSRPWTKAELRMLKTLTGQQTKTTVTARKLKRTYVATRQKASTLGVTLGEVKGREGGGGAGDGERSDRARR